MNGLLQAPKRQPYSTAQKSSAKGIGRIVNRAVFTSVLALVLIFMSQAPAPEAVATVPGTPGVPQPGTPAFVEDFENNPASTAINYKTYVGASPMLNTYTGSPKWINGARCNGVIVAYEHATTPAWAQSGSTAATSGANGLCSDSAGVRSYQFLRVLAQGMGQQFTPQSPSTNRVASSYTECQSSSSGGGTCDTLPTGTSLASGSVMFKTATPFTTIPGHYYVFGIDTAYINCSVAGGSPGYQFATVNPSTGAVTALGAPLNGCNATSNPNVQVSTQSVRSEIGGNFGPRTLEVRINSMTTNQAIKATGTKLGLQMHNTNGATAGNDGAFDNVRANDVTPQLHKAFAPELVAPGQASTVILTVTNTSELNAKTDWNVTDTLPAGLVIAPTPSFGGTCKQVAGDAYVRTGAAGANRVAVTGGDLAAGQASCTITFDVVAADEGTYVNGAGNITSNLNPPGDATLVVKEQSVQINKLWTIQDAAGTTIGTFHQPAQVGDTSSNLPEGFTATATANGSAVTWGETRKGYPVGKSVTLDEKDIELPPGCELITSEVTSVGDAPLGTPEKLPYSLAISGDPAEQKVEITNSVSCTQKLTLEKKVAFGSEPSTSWKLSAVGPENAKPGPNGISGSPEAVADVTPGAKYSLAESGGPETYVPSNSGWKCEASSGQVTPSDGAVVLEYGQSANCTITNTTAKMTLLKHVVGGDLTPDQFRLAISPSNTKLPSHSSIDGASAANSSNTFEVRPDSQYALTEEAINPDLSYLSLGLQKSEDEGVTWTKASSTDVTVPAGTHVYFRFVNQSVPELAIPLTGGTSSFIIFLCAGAAGALVAGLLIWRRLRAQTH